MLNAILIVQESEQSSHHSVIPALHSLGTVGVHVLQSTGRQVSAGGIQSSHRCPHTAIPVALIPSLSRSPLRHSREGGNPV
jgi:hypothetical protein